MSQNFYVASCVFTEEYPKISEKVCDYVRERFKMPIIRCCVDKYKVLEFEQRISADFWRSIEHFREFPAESTMISVCHNCSAIFEERHPEIRRKSLWELILSDEKFPYKNFHGEKISVQDCWRSKENFAEQTAVREILHRMNFEVVELPENHAETKFCGVSLYQPQPPRNPKLAPKRFLHDAQGFFVEHTPEQKKSLMEAHCSRISTQKVVAYCHYCVRGLKLGGKTAFHLAELLF